MPIYDFKCRKCGKLEERITHFDEQITACSCGGTADRQFHCSYGINMGVGAYGY